MPKLISIGRRGGCPSDRKRRIGPIQLRTVAPSSISTVTSNTGFPWFRPAGWRFRCPPTGCSQAHGRSALSPSTMDSARTARGPPAAALYPEGDTSPSREDEQGNTPTTMLVRLSMTPCPKLACGVAAKCAARRQTRIGRQTSSRQYHFARSQSLHASAPPVMKCLTSSSLSASS